MSGAAMSGPDHFLMAEKLLKTGNPDASVAAQVHATLALVAVTAELASHASPPSQRTYPDTGWRALIEPHHPAETTSPF
jgi:hypothetical protein